MSRFTSRICFAANTGLFGILVTQFGCAGKVESAALSNEGAGSGGAAVAGGATVGPGDTCTDMACDSEMGGAPALGGASAVAGALAAGNSTSTGGTRAIVACPGVALSDTTLDDGSACAGVSLEIEPEPVDLFVMLDRTLSMTNLLTGSSLDRWAAIERGFQLISTPGTTRVALNYFGKTGNPADPVECDPNTYAQTAVPMDYLSNNANDLAQSVQAERALLGGQTPYSAALQGGLQWAQQWQATNTGRRTALVLVTDGYPTECDTDATHIASMVDEALQSSMARGQPIYTFVIGIAVGKSVLDTIAQAGGTSQATIVDGPDAPAQFAAALSNIAASTLPSATCAWEFPYLVPAGQAIDPTLVRVILRPSDGILQVIPRVESAASCSGPNGGWYFDDLSNPKTMTLCPCSCATAGSVELWFGCRTGPLIT